VEIGERRVRVAVSLPAGACVGWIRALHPRRGSG
jgi:hypothetical protein